VRWTAGERDVTGIAADIDDDGALVVRTRSGIERIISGEVSWNPEHEPGTRNPEP
jgi:biotin-(acetyl-CoA carboxylase) ligase